MSTENIQIRIGTSESSTALTHPTSKARVTVRLAVAVFCAVMGSLQFGYNTGVINAPEKVIKEFINATYMNRTGNPMSDGTILSFWSLIVSIFAVGGVIGGLMAGWWADTFGRRTGMLINTVFGIAAGLLMYFSRMAASYEMIIVGRLVVGFNCGLYTGLTPLYLSEIGAANIRGALGTLHQLGVVIGILLSQVLGFPEVLGNEAYWQYILGLAIVPCVLQILTMPICPESPRYLLITKGKEEQARKALEILRGTTDVDLDIKEMQAENMAQEAEGKVGLIRLFAKRSLRKPLFISIVMQLSQQLSGINAIFYYSSSFFKSAGLSDFAATHATSGVGATMVVMTLITIPLMDRAGRRTLHLVGLSGMFIFSILITVTLALKHLVPWFQTASVVMALLYVTSFAVGPGSIPWLIVAELFSQGPRPAAMSVSVFVNWVSNFAVGYAFPYMQSGLQNYSFLPFTGLLAIFVVFTFFLVPETKNKTFDEISALFKRSSDVETRPKVLAKENTHLVSYKKY